MPAAFAWTHNTCIMRLDCGHFLGVEVIPSGPSCSVQFHIPLSGFHWYLPSCVNCAAATLAPCKAQECTSQFHFLPSQCERHLLQSTLAALITGSEQNLFRAPVTTLLFDFTPSASIRTCCGTSRHIPSVSLFAQESRNFYIVHSP